MLSPLHLLWDVVVLALQPKHCLLLRSGLEGYSMAAVDVCMGVEALVSFVVVSLGVNCSGTLVSADIHCLFTDLRRG